MQRSIGWSLVVLGLVALVAAAPGPRDDVRATVTVNVQADCRGTGVTVSINPWVATLARGDSLVWNHTGADSMDIRPLRGWPFPGVPARARAAAPARAGAVVPTAPPGQRFPYQIALYCADRTVIIDPDVVIGEG